MAPAAMLARAGGPADDLVLRRGAGGRRVAGADRHAVAAGAGAATVRLRGGDRRSAPARWLPGAARRPGRWARRSTVARRSRRQKRGRRRPRRGRRRRRARAAAEPVIELEALAALERAWRLDAVLRAQPTVAEEARLAELLVRRAAMFHVLGRAIPESGDLEAVARLDPARGANADARRAPPPRPPRATAGRRSARIAEAREAFALAARLGGVPPDALPPAAGAAGSDRTCRATSTAGCSAVRRCRRACCPWPRRARRSWTTCRARFAGRTSCSKRIRPRPSVLELVALIFGRAGRFGGTERMLMELAFHTPDRAAGLARGAVGLGAARAPARGLRAVDPRRALARRADDPLWLKAIACARRDPGAGGWQEIRAYVLARARPEQREALAAALDGRSLPVAGDAGPDGSSSSSGPDAGPDGAR